MRFFEKFMKDEARANDIAAHIDAWHLGDSPEPLHVYLGMPAVVYAAWVANPASLLAHRTVTSFEYLEEELHQLVGQKHAAHKLKLLNAGSSRSGEHYWRFKTSSGQIVTLTMEVEKP
jgi:hypothetical protein